MGLRDIFNRLTDYFRREPNHNFSGLTRMFGTGAGDLKAAVKALNAERSPENLYQTAFEVFRLVKPYQVHFIYGNEDLWDDCVRKMKALAEEAAAAENANSDACNLAGIIAATTWAFDWEVTRIPQDGSERQVERPHKDREPALQADLPQALEWFEKGAALGCEVCSKNAEMAKERIRAGNTPGSRPDTNGQSPAAPQL